MSFQSPLTISTQDIHSVATTESGIYLGQHGLTSDGREFVYEQSNASTSLVAGQVQMQQPTVANHLSRTLTTAQAIGSTTVLVPLGATLATQSQYAGGYLVVVSGTGKGYSYRIKDNLAAALSTTCTVILSGKEPVLVALDTTSVVSLYPNPFANVAVQAHGTSTANSIVGATITNVPVNNNFWAQITGMAPVLSNGNIASTNEVIASATTDGAVDTISTASTQALGYAPYTTVSTQYQPIMLQLAI